jgi:hypothetical protein
VYEALGYEMDPDTVGSVGDELGEGAWLDRVEAAIHQELGRRFDVRPDRPDAATLARAETLAAEHDLADAGGGC